MNKIDADLLSKAVEEARNAIAIFSADGKFEWINKAFTHLTGYTFDEVAGKKSSDIFEQSLVQEGMGSTSGKEVNQSSDFQEVYCNRKDGSYFWAKVSLSPIFDEKGDPENFVAVCTEITEKKELLQKLISQVENNDKIFSSLKEGYILVDEHANIHEVNPAYCNIVGYTKEELLSMKLTDLRPGMTQDYQREFIESVVAEGGKTFQTEHKTKNGRMVELEATAAAIEREGTIFMAGFVWDITERKKADRRLRESEERWQRLIDFNPESVLVIVDGEIEYINEAGVRLVGGKSKDDVIGKSVSSFTSSPFQENIKKRLKNLSEGESVSPVEYELVPLDGKKKTVRAHSVHITYRGKNAIQSVLTDITDLKKRERELKASQQRFKSLFDHNPHPVYYFDMEGNFVGANKKTEEVSGYPEDELLSMNFAPIIIDEDLERTIQHFEKAAAGEVQEYDIKIKTKNGAIKDLRVTNFPMRVSNEIVGVFGIAEDITTRKKAASDLKRSEQKWQHLVEDNPQPVQVTINGEIVFINEAGAKLYGAETPEDIIGSSIFQFSHPDYVKKTEERKEKLEKGMKVEQLQEHKIVLVDGESRYVEVNSIPITYQGEDAIQTVLHDITDRKKKESIIEAALVEKEVLLKEIHHRVKNNMAVISGLLELQAMNTEDNHLQVLLKESQLRIFSMAMIHEKLYQTETFADIEFAEYIKELVKTITNTIEVPAKEISITYDLEPIRLNINQAIPAALVLNEAVVNCYKHAFVDQSSGTIEISMMKDVNKLILKVKDDGKGLPKDFNLEDHQSLGTTLIHTLTKQLHGELSLSADSKESGTNVEVSFEKDS